MKSKSGHRRYRLSVAAAAGRRGGFTLTELVVSIGILALMMAMVGTVFKVTTDSTSDAKAVMEISQALRMLEDTLRLDLASVIPSRSMMVIQANPVTAYWTAAHAAVDDNTDPSDGYPHAADPERETYDLNLSPPGFRMSMPRADVLMFFTCRKQRSALYPEVWSNLAQVVYGHAEIGKLDSTGAWVLPEPAPYPDPTFPLFGDYYATPAEDWHLARRSVLIVDTPEDELDDLNTSAWGPGDDIPNTPDDNGWNPDGSTEDAHKHLLKDGVIDLIDTADLGFSYEQHVVERISRVSETPNLTADWFRRTRMDLQPPPQVAGRMAHYFIPHCASFKVEWTVDHPDIANLGLQNVVWLDPGRVDSQGQEEALDELVDLGLSGLRNRLATKFALGPTGLGLQTPVWYAADAAASDPDYRYFPTALRITVDAYDQSSRLSRPIRHVMVLPVGTQ
jgi:prepilin-type N-terminal cleavage/methylation domain-containing protein